MQIGTFVNNNVKEIETLMSVLRCSAEGFMMENQNQWFLERKKVDYMHQMDIHMASF